MAQTLIVSAHGPSLRTGYARIENAKAVVAPIEVLGLFEETERNVVRITITN